VAQETEQRGTLWGPLSQPIHPTVPEGMVVSGNTGPWKDNAYIPFWDPEQNVFATFHVSTSPEEAKSSGMMSRFSLSVDGRVTEFVERLPPASFDSESIKFDLDGRVTIDHRDVKAELSCTPRLAIGDFTLGESCTYGGPPLSHYEVTVDVTGTIETDGSTVNVAATGLRDRTWGFRDESLHVEEMFWGFATFPTFSICWHRMRHNPDGEKVDGFVLTETGARQIKAITPVARDASGMLAYTRFHFVDGGEMEIRATKRRAGFLVPMSPFWERIGPTSTAFDEFCELRTDSGDEGFGVIEHLQVRQIF
jgi:hypothetical protein